MIKNKLIRARKEKKFSQQDVAEFLSISQTQYLRKEKGEIGITEQEWDKIAKLLNVEVEEIKEDNGKSISQHFENVTGSYAGSYIGSNNNYCNIPEFLLENQKEYIELLKKEIESLKAKLSLLENN